jgi:hypothetical protein
MRSLLPRIEVVTNLSLSDDADIQTLVDGRADLSPDTWGMTYQDWLCRHLQLLEIQHDFFFFFNGCILWYYLSKPLTSLSCSLNGVIPCLKMREHLGLHYCNLLNPFYYLHVWERAQWGRVTEKSHVFQAGIEPKPPAWLAASQDAQPSTTSWPTWF